MTRFLLALALSALFLPAARAQPASVFDAAALDALFDHAPKVEVNLHGALLRLAASASEGDDEGAGAMLRGLRSIVVRVYSLAAARAGLADRLSSLGSALEGSGWTTLVRVRPDGDEDDDVWVYVREAGDAFDGMAVMSLDHDGGDASFVFIDGPIDPSQVGSLGTRFGGVSLDDPETLSDEEMQRIEDEAERTAEEVEAEVEQAMEAADEAQEAADEAQAAANEAQALAEAARVEAERAAKRARDDAARAAQKP